MERLSFDGGVQSQPHGHSKAWLSVVSMQSRAMQLHSTTRSGGLCRAPLDCWVRPSFSIVGKVTLKRPKSALFTKIARAREDPEKKNAIWGGVCSAGAARVQRSHREASGIETDRATAVLLAEEACRKADGPGTNADHSSGRKDGCQALSQGFQISTPLLTVQSRLS